MRIILLSSSNTSSAMTLANSVLPTPVGPRKRKDAIGASGLLSPERFLLMEFHQKVVEYNDYFSS